MSSTPGEKPAAPGTEVDHVTYVCPRCGKKFEREEHVVVDPRESLKLYGTIGFGILFLLGVWVWVFQWGVPLVQRLTGE